MISNTEDIIEIGLERIEMGMQNGGNHFQAQQLPSLRDNIGINGKPSIQYCVEIVHSAFYERHSVVDCKVRIGTKLLGLKYDVK